MFVRLCLTDSALAVEFAAPRPDSAFARPSMPPPGLQVTMQNTPFPSPPSPVSSPRFINKPTRRASLVNAKLSGMADSFIERGRQAGLAMRQATEAYDLPTLRGEVQTLKSATSFVQATRVRAVCVAFMIQCDQAMKVVELQKAEGASRRASREEMVPGFWEDAREQIYRLEKELAGYVRSVEMARTPREKDRNDNVYTFDETLEEKEQEKAMLSWNKEVYEARVVKAFVEEKLVRSLYQQQIQHRSRRIHQHHKEHVRQNQLNCEAFDTPYTRKKQLHKATEDALAMAIEQHTPRFNDVADLSPRVAQDQLSRRGLAAGATSVASPASIRDLTRSVTLPPLNSLMNPRNQMTSPLPDKDTLLPPSRHKKRAEAEGKQRNMALGMLLKFIAVCFEEKRTSESNLQRESGPIDVGPPTVPLCVPLMKAINETLHREHGSSDICAEKLQQLKNSCASSSGHGSHPRVAIFRRMAGWDEENKGMDPVQEAACTALLSWFGIATLYPPDKEARLLLRLKEVPRVLDNLHRVRLLPPRARSYFIDLANELRLSPAELPRQSQTPIVDADTLVWRWMDSWGGWDEMLFGKDNNPEMLSARVPAAAPASEF